MAATILVVEDRPNWRESFCEWLRAQDFHVVEATCGVEFKRKAASADVIILDIAIPMQPNGPEDNTAGLDVLIELQKEYPDHKAIHNPIIRSMWSPDLFGPRYHTITESVPALRRWCSREVPVAELKALIDETMLTLQESR